MRYAFRLSSLAALAVAMALPAKAADLPAKAPPPAPPVCIWCGFYAGFNLGASEDLSKATDTWVWSNTFPTGTLIGIGGGALFATTSPLTTNTVFANQHHNGAVGFIGGLQAGYNWQSGNFVFGVEGDWSWSNPKSTTSTLAQPVAGIFPPLPNFFFAPGSAQGWTSEEKINWLATLRGRLGWAQERTLWYLTGGVAFAQIDSNYTLVSSPGLTGAANGNGSQFGLAGGTASASFGTTKTGWALGGGVETAIGGLFGTGSLAGWTAKLEYLWVDLGTVTNTFTAPLVPVCGATCAPGALVTGTTTFTSSSHVYDQIIRVGVNYKFGSVFR